jgi:hypothetical protein
LDLVYHSKNMTGLPESSTLVNLSQIHKTGIAAAGDPVITNIPMLVSVPRGDNDAIFAKRKPKGTKLARIVKRVISLQ